MFWHYPSHNLFKQETSMTAKNRWQWDEEMDIYIVSNYLYTEFLIRKQKEWRKLIQLNYVNKVNTTQKLRQKQSCATW